MDSDRCDAYAHVTGRVVDETKNMLVVSDGHRQRWIPKDVVVFHFTLPDRTTCRVEGKTLLGADELKLLGAAAAVDAVFEARPRRVLGK